MTHTIQQAYISRVSLKSASIAITNNNSIVQLFFLEYDQPGSDPDRQQWDAEVLRSSSRNSISQSF